LLNDYEEGTWTPTLVSATPPTTPYTVGFAGAKYTKVGRAVTITAYVFTNSVDTTGAAGNLAIGGLPFADSANTAFAVSLASNWVNAPTAAWSTSTSMVLQKRATSTGAMVDMTAADLTTGATASQNIVCIAGTYLV
jgi:hypothetical protein